MSPINSTLLIYLFGLGLYALIAFLAFRRSEIRPRIIRILLVYLLVSWLWMAVQVAWRMGWLDSLVEEFVIRLAIDGVLVLALLFLLLTRTLLHPEDKSWTWWVIGGIWGLVLILLDSDLLSLPEVLWKSNGRYLPRDIAVSGVLNSGWVLFTFAAPWMIVRAYRGDQPAQSRTTTSYWIGGLFFTVLGDVFFLMGYQAPGAALRLGGALIVAYVLLTPKLPELNKTLQQFFNRFASFAADFLVYLFAFILIQSVFRLLGIENPLFGGFSLALLLILLLNPLLSAFRKTLPGTDRLTQNKHTQTLRQYSQSITNILDLKLLATVSVGTASEALDIHRGFLFLVDHEKVDGKEWFHLRGEKGMGETAPAPIEMSEDSPLVEFLRFEQRPLTAGELNWQIRFKRMSLDERSWLEHMGAVLLVPIYVKNEWVGLLAFGPKSSGADYNDDDLALIGMLADQTAVAMENVRLVEGLLRLNSEFRRAYAALDLTKRHIERLDRTKSDFINISSHELRTPLTLISGAGQMLLSEKNLEANPYYHQLLGKIKTGTDRLHEILDAMLDMAKIDTRALELEPQPVALDGMIGAVSQGFAKTLADRKIELTIQDLAGLPPIEADVTALRKVFAHVIVNAIKYTPDGGKINITGRAVAADHSRINHEGIEIVIADTGIGIDPRYHELIFDKFYQTGEMALHSTGKTKFKGSGPGLGLAITRGIVEAHGGMVWVESPGYDEQNCPGSKFHILLPLHHKSMPFARAQPDLFGVNNRDLFEE